MMLGADPTEGLAALAVEVSGCTRCRLAETRTQVVFGAGNPDADLMFVGEAPGFHEDQQGVPFVGQAGKLLERLLAGIGLQRSDVYIANVLKCLRYNARVQLGDGSWERIGQLVAGRYSGEVMSLAADGSLVRRKVVGWHATPLGGRRVLRLTYASAKRAGASHTGIELTADHPVLTRRGFVPAGELRADDQVATGQGMSRLAFDVVCGTLLGDGTIRAGNAHLAFSHSTRQAEYARFKQSLLEELEPRATELAVRAVVGDETLHGAIHVRTRARRALRIVHGQFYAAAGKHVPSWLEERLNERMLAIWFMDDGYTRIRPGRRPLAEIATNGFSADDLQVLLRALDRLDLPAKALRGRLFFDAATTKRLSERIAPFVPEPMRRKLDPEAASSVPFDSERFERGPAEVLFDDVRVEDVTDRSRTDTTFFCIDVEGTANFVTSGGVVHNCRPPGNRDPLPDEIEACEAHLFRQVGLIRPTVVATLGNFATKLLSGKPTGITRVHGTEQEVDLGGRRVILYPLYHPAAALYTPAMLKVLEEDFQRLPAIMSRALDGPRLAEPIAVTAAPPVIVDNEPASGPDDAVQLGLF